MKTLLIDLYKFEDFNKEEQKLICAKLRQEWGINLHDREIIIRISQNRLVFNKNGDVITNVLTKRLIKKNTDFSQYMLINQKGQYSNGYIGKYKNSFGTNLFAKKWNDIEALKKYIKMENIDNSCQVIIEKYQRVSTEIKNINEL